jgi:archaellum component FlaC
MADDKDKFDLIKRIKEEISRLDKATAKAYQDQLKGLDAINTDLDTYKKLLSNIKDDVADLNKGFAGILKEINSIVAELEKGNKSTKDTTKAFRGLESIVQKLKSDQQGYVDLNLDQLKQEKSKLEILEDQARGAAKQLAREKGIKDLKNANLSTLQNISEEEEAILRAAQEGFTVYERTNKQLEKRIKKEKEINRKLGVTGTLLKGMSKIPIVGPLLKTNEALDLARKKAKAGGNSFQVMGTALGSMGKSLMTSLSDPLVTIGLIVAAFKALIKLGFRADKQVVDLQKSLYLSRGAAEGLRENFQYIANANPDKPLINLRNQVEAAMQLSNAMGAVGLATNKEIQSQIVLTKQMGLSVEDANALYVLGRQNKMTSTEVVGEIQKQVKANQKQTGVLLDAKKITQDVAKINGQLRLQYGNNVKQLASAVIQANKLGFSLEQTKKIAEGLLNFEESIENELSAELLIGRDLNLEQARLLALNGKSAEATALIAENMGGSAGFASMNVIQQESLAKALGMSADELANSILYQENLNRLGKEDKKRLEDQLDYLRSIGAEEQAQQLERAVANGTNIEAAMNAVDAQTRFNETVEKFKDLLADIVDGPAMKLANGLVEMLNTGKGLYRVLGGIATILTTMSVYKLVIGLIQASVAAGTMAASTAAAASALTLGTAALVIVGGIALIMNGMYAAADQAETRATKPAKANFATGGIVRSRIDNATIGERGPEAIIPLSSPSAKQMMNGGGPIQVTVYGQIDKQTLFTFIAEGERTNSNNLATERQKNNVGIQ